MKFLIIIFFSIQIMLASTLELSMSSSPSKLNPILPADSASSSVSNWIFNGLFTYDKNGNITPELADSYSFISPTKLLIKLKEMFYGTMGKNSHQKMFFLHTIQSKVQKYLHH